VEFLASDFVFSGRKFLEEKNIFRQDKFLGAEEQLPHAKMLPPHCHCGLQTNFHVF